MKDLCELIMNMTLTTGKLFMCSMTGGVSKSPVSFWSAAVSSKMLWVRIMVVWSLENWQYWQIHMHTMPPPPHWIQSTWRDSSWNTKLVWPPYCCDEQQAVICGTICGTILRFGRLEQLWPWPLQWMLTTLTWMAGASHRTYLCDGCLRKAEVVQALLVVEMSQYDLV